MGSLLLENLGIFLHKVQLVSARPMALLVNPAFGSELAVTIGDFFLLAQHLCVEGAGRVDQICHRLGTLPESVEIRGEIEKVVAPEIRQGFINDLDDTGARLDRFPIGQVLPNRPLGRGFGHPPMNVTRRRHPSVDFLGARVFGRTPSPHLLEENTFHFAADLQQIVAS